MDACHPVIIYTPSPIRQALDWRRRLTALLVALACLTVLLTALVLKPNPRGIGTHTALGFDSCTFLRTTGLPCFTCGMTTSFAWFVRGNWIASLYVQPMGFVLALLTAASFWAGLYIALTAKPAHRLLHQSLPRYYLLALMAWGVLAWGWKIFIHLRGIDGWS